MNHNMTDQEYKEYIAKVEEAMGFNCCFESSRKAMIRASQEKRRNMEYAAESIWALKRVHHDNLIGRLVSSTLMLSSNPQKLIAFCHEVYGSQFEFDEHMRTGEAETGFGKGSFHIEEIGIIR